MADIFRKKSLDKLSSPEQLDKMIILNSPMTWLALIGGGFIILTAFLWGIFSRVPITKDGSGILIGDGTINSVYASTQGVITKTNVSSGDTVEIGDVLYEVNSQETAQLLKQLEQRIQKVEAVTFESVGDEVTNDNQSLISIKNQKMTLSMENQANGASLDKLRENYKEKEREVSRLKQELDAAETAYYNGLSSDNSSVVEYEYNKAVSEYQNAESSYQKAYAAYASANSTLEMQKRQWEEANAAYEALTKEPYPEDASEQDIVAAIQQAYAAAEEYRAQYEQAEQEAESYYWQLEQMREERDGKKSEYETKKASYEAYIGSLGETTSDTTKNANTYNTALSKYNTAKAQLESLETEIETMELQLSLGEDSKKTQEDSLKAEFEAAKAAILDALKLELENGTALTEGKQIKAPVSGVVYSTVVSNGSIVSVDMEVARISQQEKDSTLQAVYFLPLDDGKSVKEGMKVNIYPSTLSKEEYGHMSGTIVSVAKYVTSYADLYTRLGESTLADTFSKSGAIVEVVCEIDRDQSTASGYAWSSQKGKTVELVEGTLLEGSVITENVPPITMLIPKLKEKLHLE